MSTSRTARQVLDESVTEAEWQRTVVEYAERRGWLWYHSHDSRRDPAGFPDLVLVRGGVTFFVELKTERGRLRPAQSRWIEALQCMARRHASIHVRIWRPSDWETVERELA